MATEDNYLLRWLQVKTLWAKTKTWTAAQIKTETDRAKGVESGLNTSIGTLSTALATEVQSRKDGDTSTLNSAKAYTDSVATGAMIWKGVKTWATLPTTGNRKGDFYTVSDKQNKEFAWDGTAWMDVGADVDFSAIQTAVDGKADKTSVYTKTEIDGKVTTINTAIGNKANSADVYTKTQTYSKTEIDGKGYITSLSYITDDMINGLT